MMHIDFMGRKYWWFALSGTVILIGLISLLAPAVRGNGVGLNLSIDFKGGSRLTATFNNANSVDDVSSAMGTAGFGDAVVQSVGDNRYQVTLPALTTDQENSIIDSLNGTLGVADKSWEVVGPTFGSQVVRSMGWAILLAWLLLIAYVSFRFEYKMAAATLIALFHDLFITVGVYSLVGREVTTATVAAVLTILGYSLYDTIIVFDRVRENTPHAKRGGYAAMVNTSIWEVMNRSIITTMLTLLPVVCLFIFGGQTLKDFAFALLVGVASGAYSSIFVAAPLLTLWKEREKRYRPSAAGTARAKKAASKEEAGEAQPQAVRARGKGKAKGGKGKAKAKGGRGKPARAR